MSASTPPKEFLTLKQACHRYAKAVSELKRLGVTGYHLGIGFTKGEGEGHHVIAVPDNSLKFSNRGPFYLRASEAHFVTEEGTVGAKIDAKKFVLLPEQNHWIW